MNDRWTIAKVATPSSGDGIFRFIQFKPESWDSLPLSEEVSISWHYDGIQPDSTTSKRMDTLEDALSNLSFGPDSYLALVMTVDGLREWCFYTRDYNEFMQTLNAGLASHGRFPIEIQHSHDPMWRYWHSFIDRLSQTK